MEKGLFGNQDGDGGEERRQRDPEGGGTYVVAIDGGLPRPYRIGFYIYHVVLLQVIDRGVI